MTETVVHSTFSVERTYPASPSRVFSAFADQATKRRWFAEGEGWEVQEFASDFLSTFEIVPSGDGARLTFTEQGAFFEGADGPDRREKGWRALLEALGKELRRPA